MKAGLMEIADFFVVNKADRAGAEQAVMSIKTVLGFKPHGEGWMPDVLQTVAQDGKGIDGVAAMIAKHKTYLESAGLLKKRRAVRLEERIHELISERLHVAFWNEGREKLLSASMEEVLSFKTTPYDLVERLLST
jgi:LAO/AO transport system kinase